MRLLDKINFSSVDELYILGDIVDRGPEPIRLVQELMMHPNIYPVLGNHEYMAHKVLSKFNVEITDEMISSLSGDDMMDYMYWIQDGGDVTVKQFVRLHPESREEILEYLEECTLYEEINIGGKRYILVHAGIDNFDEGRDMDTYLPSELLFQRADYGKRYFLDRNTFLIAGHMPTFGIRSDRESLIYEGNGHIAIDCGCVYGGHLAAFCLDNGECTYVESKKSPIWQK
ncbi:MAG: fructose-bisphosphatase class III [Clostridiales bacterium]|nr:fructose-bisphosphatase class III [Clostridiales bacterium]